MKLRKVICFHRLLILAGSVFTLYFIGTATLEHWFPSVQFNKDSQVVCRIPLLDPWSNSIRLILATKVGIPAKLNCELLDEALMPSQLSTKLEGGRLMADNATSADVIAQWNNCSYRCIERKDGHNDRGLVNGTWKIFSLATGANVDCELVEVWCVRGDREYRLIHPQIVVNRTRLAEAQRISNGIKGADGMPAPTVIIWMFESTSRSIFRRRLPKTHRYLTEELGAFPLMGYNKVGENTFPNAIAMFTGRVANSTELPDNTKGPFDNYPFIHKEFHKRGYITYWNENWGFLNYLRRGFKYRPADHYLRPFAVAMEESRLYKAQRNKTKIKQHRKHAFQYCYGKTRIFEILFKNMMEFLFKYPNAQPKFVFMMESEISHDRPENLASNDGHILDVLKQIRSTLNNTFLFMIGDHGSRYSPIRSTEIGRLEEHMPMFSIVVPPRLKNDLKHTLDTNRMRLASNYDMYITLWDIMLSHKRGWNFSVQPEEWHQLAPRGLSLLRPLPKTRTCDDAGIPSHYCICHAGTSIDISTTVGRSAAEFSVQAINQKFQDGNVSQLCETLHLAKIHSAVQVLSSGLIRVVFETKPGGGLFEGNLIQHGTKFSLHGRIARINRYGSQSACISEPAIRPFCLCKDPNIRS